MVAGETRANESVARFYSDIIISSVAKHKISHSTCSAARSRASLRGFFRFFNEIFKLLGTILSGLLKLIRSAFASRVRKHDLSRFCIHHCDAGIGVSQCGAFCPPPLLGLETLIETLIERLLVWAFSFVNGRGRAIVDHHGWSARCIVADGALNDVLSPCLIGYYQERNVFLNQCSGEVRFISSHRLDVDSGPALDMWGLGNPDPGTYKQRTREFPHFSSDVSDSLRVSQSIQPCLGHGNGHLRTNRETDSCPADGARNDPSHARRSRRIDAGTPLRGGAREKGDRSPDSGQDRAGRSG
jgi:hypothetical protein